MARKKIARISSKKTTLSKKRRKAVRKAKKALRDLQQAIRVIASGRVGRAKPTRTGRTRGTGARRR